MAPKQASIGYVKPAQTTLGKFFSNPNGAKPAPQQSKLAFSSKTKSAEGEDVKAEINGKPAPGPIAHLKKEASKSTEGLDVKKEENGDISMVNADESSSPKIKTESSTQNGIAPVASPLRKRSVAEDMDEEDDEEPPSKKQRTKPTPKSNLNKSEVTKGQPRKSVGFNADVKDNEDKPSKIDRKATPKKSGTTLSAKDDVDADEEQATPLKKASKKATVVQASKTEEDDDAESVAESDQEEEVESDEEDEKPELAAKARAKVQTTLSGKTKDPYPDWKPGEPVPYAALCTTFSKIELTTKRLEIQAHCSLFLRQVLSLTPNDLLPTVLLMVNKLAADYTGIELGIGESLIMKAIGESTGRSLKIIKDDQKEIGDLGLVAAKSRSNQPTMFKPKPLTVRGVHERLIVIAKVEGKNSQTNKVNEIKKLLSSADSQVSGKGGVDIAVDKGGPSESKFLIRTLEGKMRLGLAEKTVVVSLAQAMVAHEFGEKGKAPSTEQLAKGEAVLKAVYNELPSYEVIIPAMLKSSIFELHESCKLQPGVPLKPMLAKPTKSITEVLDRFEGKHFTCEYKYDGERAQIHYVAHDTSLGFATSAPTSGRSDRGVSNIFSRNSEDLSKKYPDILAKLPTWVKETTKSFVLDCETVGWDVEQQKVLPFQTLMTRKRKDVKVEDVKIKVCVFAFDILFLNGEPLVNQPFRARREAMQGAFNEVEGEFAFAKYGDTNELDEIQILLDESVKASCEGLMVKMLDGVESHYEPSRRSQNWLKVKKDYLSGVGDSLDLVVLGAYFGSGKRTGWYGAFLLACYNPGTQVYETVCNIGTGFSEQILEELHTQLSALVIDRPKPFYSHSAGNKDQPDVWFEPKFVWEVKTADLTLSPRYKAAASQMEGGKGVSLRFPRFLKVREDKKPDEATTSRSVAEMYRKQDSVGGGKSKGPAADDDFEY